jgi:DNA polymerase elongation subunit (family B)
MSKFYTNIEVRGNNILYRGYDNGMPIQQKIPFKPCLFIKDSSGKSKYLSQSNGSCVQPKTFDSIDELKQYVETYKDIPNFDIYGCSNMVRQFTGQEFSGDISWDYKQTQIYVFDIETTVENGFPDPQKAEEEILLISLVCVTSGRVYLWSAKPISEDNQARCIAGIDIRVFATERELLKDFVMFWATNRIDVISGWNSEQFDIPYCVNRIKRVLGENVVKLLSPWGIVKPRTVNFDTGEGYVTYDILGVTHLDYLDLYKKFNPGSKESFKLDFIAEIELGERKVELPGESFKDNYENHWETFCWYSVIDSMLLMKLEQKMMLIMLAMELAFVAKCQFADVVSSMRLWESIIYNYFLDNNIIEDWEKRSNSRVSIMGGYVHDPIPKKYGWAISIDATSLYPSIMMQNNISPDTKGYKIDYTVDDILDGLHIGKVPEGFILSGNGQLTKKGEWGFIPVLVKRMFDMRKLSKNKMLELKKAGEPESVYSVYDVKQKAFKVAANALFGVQALPHFKYYDTDLAEAITSTGQVFIKAAQKYINLIMNKVIGTHNEDFVSYSDTDSVFIIFEKFVEKFCKDKSDTEIVDYIEKFVFDVLQKALSKKLTEFASTMGISDCKIDFKLECIGPNIIHIAKKRYAFHVLYAEGVRYSPEKPYLKVTGIEIVRSSTPSAIRDYLKDCVSICLAKNEKAIQSHVKKVKQEFMKLDYTAIAFPRGVNGLSTYADSASIYKKGTPIHVRGSLLFNHHLAMKGLEKKYQSISEGDKVKFIALKMPNTIHEDVIAFSGKLPPEFDLVRFVDYQKQFEKAFIKPLDGILEAIGWTAEEVVTLDFG